MLSVISLLSLLAIANGADQIDPKIYAKLFMNNKPIFDHISGAVSGRLPLGGKVLDLASGPGEPTLTLAKMEPKAEITCTDFQPAMNEKAQARVKDAGVTNVDFAVTSADDLIQWHDNYFDAVMMCYGLMFVPDKAESLREISRVLKAGGLAYISVWKKLTYQTFAREAIEEVAGKTMPDFTINPMKLKDENAVEELAKAAGLEIVADDRMSYPFPMGTAKEAADGSLIMAGGLLKQLEAEGDAGATARYYAFFEREIEKRGWKDADGTVFIPDNAPQILTLRKPSKSEL